MNWENLTSPEFAGAVKTSGGVCMLPLGVIEKHGDHLPLGQDTIYIHDVTTLAAAEEPAVVFPFFYFGQILEARHVPGTIALRGELLIPLLENVCDEIGRNGFTKIFLVNGHGGNSAMLRYFLQLQLGREKPYMLYMTDFFMADKKTVPLRESVIDGHAGEEETTSMMYLRPELVKQERFAEYGLPLGRLLPFREAGISTGVDWYADYPGHFAGERVPLTHEKGEAFVKAHVALLVRQLKLIKRDDTPLSLYREYHSRTASLENRTT
jgi:creatinine amidohydrolase